MDVVQALFPWPAFVTYPLYFWGGHAWTVWVEKRRAKGDSG